MMQIDGVISTSHRNPSCIAKAIRIDNLSSMRTAATGTGVTTTVEGTRLRSVIASVDDYLMNLGIAEEACRYRNRHPGSERTVAYGQQEKVETDDTKVI